MDTAGAIAILVLIAVVAVFIAYYVGRFKGAQNIRSERQKAIAQSRAVLGGQFTEQMAPYLPEFKYDPTEARFIGSPIDLVVFPGLAQGDPREIVIMEIKTGQSSRLTPSEKKIQQLIEDGMVRWELIQRPGDEKP